MREEGETLELYDGPPTQQGGAPSGLASTGILLPNDPTVTAPWSSYFDTAERKYFYVNSSTNTAQYEHPFPPIFSGSDTVVRDITVAFLPSGWLKLQSKTLNIPYYLHTPSLETRWVHANPPPDPSALAQAVDATLNSTYKKYIDPTTTRPFFINSTTLEGQWNFPDSAFNVGPSTAQQASSALAQAISGAQASSAVAQGASSAVAQAISGAQQSSAVAQQASSAVAQSISGAQQSSAVAQHASSALAQSISGAEASSAVAQQASSSLSQRISSAVAQTASSALAQSISGARQSSAIAQFASSAVAQTVSSAVAQNASSAQQLQVLAAPLADKDAMLQTIRGMQSDIQAQVAILYSSTASQSDKAVAQQSIRDLMGPIQSQLQALSDTSATIFSIAPKYQDRGLQTLISSPYLESMGLKKLYDTMRKAYIVIDSNGYIVPNVETPSTRVPTQRGGATGSTSVGLLSTDVALTGDQTVSAPWTSYFDTVARRYFYANSSTNAAQYEHPFPPVFSGSDIILSDSTVAFLPNAWIKLKSSAKNLPYYINVLSTETSWVHPNPPPNPSTLAQAVDATLNSTYKKYIDPTTTRPFFINSTTLEGQWNFPDSAFNVGPSTAQQASSALAQAISGAQASSAVAQFASSAVAQVASSAVAQKDSSAQQQTVSSANYQRVTAATVAYRYFLFTIFSPRLPPDISDPYNIIASDSAIGGFFLNKTNVALSWKPAATAIAVDPVSLQPLKDADGAPITYTSGSQYGNIFDRTFTAKVFPVQPSGTYPVSILIDNTVPIMFNAYYFGVGDSSNADVVQWSLQGSVDGINFFMVDDQSSAPRTDLVPNVRNSFIPPIELNISYKQDASSAIRQRASSAVAQTASSSLVQRSSSAVAQQASTAQASSALAQAISGSRESSAVAQAASSALVQAISGARESSSVAQQASSAVAQAISGAQQSSAVAQQASSAIAQSISGAQQSSAVAQADSLAQQQTASSSYQQRDSSAQQQTVSSAVKQSVSSAQYEAASSALAQKASSAIAQTVSSALAYTASSAQQQTASSANAENDLASYMNDKDAIKSTLVPIQTETNALIRAVYSPAGGVTMATLSQLQNNITTVVDQQNILHTTANNIFRFHDYYQDPALQTLIPDTKLTSMGLKKVFDTLRNKYIVLDSRGAIVSNPVNPATRSYTTFVLRGGKRAPRHSRRTYRAVLK